MKKLLFILFISLSFIACNNNKMTSYEHIYENIEFDTAMFHIDETNRYKYEYRFAGNEYRDDLYITYENGTLWLTCAGKVIKFDNTSYIELEKEEMIINGLVVGHYTRRIWYNDNGPIAVEYISIDGKYGYNTTNEIVTHDIEWSKKYINK